MPKAVLNGVKIFYQQAGTGPDVVLIHGLAANHAFWYLLIARALKKHFRVTIFDLRGHGYSDVTPSGYTSSQMAEDLGMLLDYLNISHAHLVGHSYGGAVALNYALHSPERIGSLTLADSRIRALQPEQRLSDTAFRTAIEEAYFEQPDVIWEQEPDIGIRLLEEFAKNPPRITGESSQGGYLPFAESRGGVKAAERWLSLLKTTTAREDFTSCGGLTAQKIETVNIPTLLMYGEHSRCLESCRALHEVLPTNKVVIVPEAGHFHPVTKPGFFMRHLKKFLAEDEVSAIPVDFLLVEEEA